ncbi:MAG: sugar-binding domain-containing protein, partial [Actinomycetota bacterium]
MIDLTQFFSPALTEIGRIPMASPLEPVSGRTEVSLDGAWDFRLAPDPGSVGDGWWDEGDWRTITVPGVWTRQDTGDLPQYTNVLMPWDEQPPNVPAANPTGLYRTTFERPPDPRVTVTFGAAESLLAVWCNGRFVGMGKDSRLASTFDLTPHLTEGANTLAAAVCRWSDATWIEDQDHWYHGGLHRSVVLTGTGEVHIADLVSNGDLDPATGRGAVDITVRVDGPGRIEAGWTVDATLEVDDGGSVAGRAELPADPAAVGGRAMVAAYRYTGREAVIPLTDLAIAPWSAEDPRRYRLTVSLIDPTGTTVEVVGRWVGFRRVEVVDRRLLVNGVPITVAGVNRHDGE